MELKTALTYEQQVNNLKEKHKLAILSDSDAISILRRISYYRLSAYGIGLKEINSEFYVPGTSIETLYCLYCFDSELRNIIFHTIEHIEIQLRSQIGNYLALKYGSECYTDSKLFQTKKNRDGIDIFESILESFHDECNRQSKLPFVQHHNQKYSGHFPIWAALELFTFGRLTSLYSILKDEDKKEIAKLYKTRHNHLISWLLSLVEIRNLCAHYSRIYNMPLKQKPYLFTEYQKYNSNKQTKVFPAMIVMKLMLEKVNLSQWQSSFKELESLFDKYSDVIKLSFMGFPAEWKSILKPTKK